MDKTDIQLLIDYNYWANARILHAAAQLSPAQFLAPYPVSFGSLRGTLVHILGAEVNWRMRFQESISLSAMLSESEFPDLETLQRRWAVEESAVRAYIAALRDNDFQQRVQYRTTKGVPQQTILWQILAHVVNHGTQFRSEAGVELTALGQSPGDTDLVYFVRETSTVGHKT